MSIKPILFNTDMVRAIQDGRKTVTRRLLKLNLRENECSTIIVSNKDTGEFCYVEVLDEWENEVRRIYGPYSPGDILWVRETWWQTQDGKFHYLADYELPELTRKQLSKECKVRPSIHMPRAAARIFLRVKDVRAERLQEITADGCLSEGVKLHLRSIFEGESPLAPFARVWNGTVKPADLALYGWDANPWVTVNKFERLPGPPAGFFGDNDTGCYADNPILAPA